jgi:hypothetical protein
LAFPRVPQPAWGGAPPSGNIELKAAKAAKASRQRIDRGVENTSKGILPGEPENRGTDAIKRFDAGHAGPDAGLAGATLTEDELRAVWKAARFSIW